ncbi:SMP-30/gluconolactonase/LRE family protein [Rhizobium giardinii]|uniref:SMP-30/gluconolactonase/LRE family protein n=1 Tax=Rhizobium giardinii TaxID=56731 RepID=UPI000DD8FC59
MREYKPTLFAEGFMFLEAPRWRDGVLWVSDVFDNKVHGLASDGRSRTEIPISNRPSGLGFLSDGSLIIVSAIDSRLLRFKDGALSTYADLSAHTTGWLNDFAVDPQDRIYAGNFGYDFVAGESQKPSTIHRVDPDGAILAVAGGMEFPNGAALIDGGRTLVFAETWDARLTAFDIAEDGTLHNRRIFADLAGRQPDGICADASGAIWAGIYNTGEFVRVLPGGEVTDRIQFDGSGISCTFGGPANSTLFMTTFIGTGEDMASERRYSAVYSADVDVPGHSEPRYNSQLYPQQ